MISNPTWPLKKLEECCRYISRGKQPKYVEKSEIKTLNQKAIQWGSIDKKSLKYHNSEIPVAEKHFILKGDLVLNSTGTGTVGRCYYFSEEPTDKIFADSHVTIIRTNKEILLPEFLYYQLSSQQYQKLIYSSFLAGSTGQVELNKSKVQEFPIYTPEIKIQEKIVNILNLLDKKINSNSKIIINLENISQTLFKHWFIDFEFPNEEGKPYKSSGGEMIESDLGRIPKMFNLSTFGEEITITRGASPRPIHDYLREEGRPWIKISDVNGLIGYYLNSTKQFIKEEGIDKSRTIEPGTLILSNSATPGIPVFVNITASVHDGWLIFKDYKKLSKEFYFLYLKTNRDKILSLSNGSVFRNLKTDILKKYQIVIPSDELFDKFQNIVMPLFNMIKNTTDEVNTLHRLRDTLLPKLLSGEIEIPDNLEV